MGLNILTSIQSGHPASTAKPTQGRRKSSPVDPGFRLFTIKTWECRPYERTKWNPTH